MQEYLRLSFLLNIHKNRIAIYCYQNFDFHSNPYSEHDPEPL